MSGGSMPSVVRSRCSGSSPSSFERRKTSTPTSKILAIGQASVTTGSGQNNRCGRSGAVESDLLEELVERDPEPPVAVEEEQQAEPHEHRARYETQRAVMGADPAERLHRVGEGDAREDEGGAEAERVGEQ